MKKILLYCSIYSILAWIICYRSLQLFADTKKDNPPPVAYKVIDVVSCKQSGDYCVTCFKVKINGHDFIKTETTQHSNIIFRHCAECEYCMRHGIDGSRYSFTTGDGFSADMKEKLDKMKKAIK